MAPKAFSGFIPGTGKGDQGYILWLIHFDASWSEERIQDKLDNRVRFELYHKQTTSDGNTICHFNHDPRLDNDDYCIQAARDSYIFEAEPGAVIFLRPLDGKRLSDFPKKDGTTY